MFVVTITLLASANMFGQSMLITQGGPGDSTTHGVDGDRSTPASASSGWDRPTAMSYLLALCLAIVSLIVFLLMRERKS